MPKISVNAGRRSPSLSSFGSAYTSGKLPNNRLGGNMKHGLTQLVVSPPSKNASQSWRFVTLEIRVISHKKEALQPLSVPKNVARNSLTFRGKVMNSP